MPELLENHCKQLLIQFVRRMSSSCVHLHVHVIHGLIKRKLMIRLLFQIYIDRITESQVDLAKVVV